MPFPIPCLVSLRADRIAETGEIRDGLSRDWHPWFARNNLEPFLLPNRAGAVVRHFDLIGPKLLVLTGGNDVVETAQGGVSWDAERSAAESSAIAIALQRGLAIFGVCRGFQVLNRYFGGELVTRETEPALAPHVAATHRIRFLTPDGLALCASGATTNSYHRYCVLPQQLAAPLQALAACEADGSIEAFVHPNHKVLALQWHPERPGSNPQLDDALLAAVLNKVIAP